jgi:succinoglycan biosynthesis transport protein ExoP
MLTPDEFLLVPTTMENKAGIPRDRGRDTNGDHKRDFTDSVLKNSEEEQKYEQGRVESAVALRRELWDRDSAAPTPRFKVNPPRAQNQFVRYRDVIQEYRLLGAAVFLGCVGIAAAVAALQPADYRAAVTLELLGINENFLNLQQVDPTTPLSSNSGGDSYTQTQLELLKRDALTERVVQRLRLDQNDRFSKHRGVLSWFKRSAPNMAATDRVLVAVRMAQKKFKVQQLRQSNLVEISFEDSDPKLAVDFVNTIAQEAVEENLRSRWGLSRNVGTWLGQHLTDLRTKMAASEHELEAYSANAGLLTTTGSSSAVDDTRLQRLQDQLARAQTNRIQKESHYTIAKSVDLDSLPEVIDDAALKEYRVRLADLRRQEADLSTALTPDHPKVQRVQAQITNLQATIVHERTNILDRLHNEYAADRREEDAVADAVAAETSKVSGITQKEIHYNTLKRELETTRSMYEDVLKRVNDTELASVTRASGMRIVDPATVPEKLDLLKSRIFVGGIGAFAGLLLAGVVVFVMEQTNNTVKSAGHTPVLLNVPELGIIPSIPNSIYSRRKLAYGQQATIEEHAGGALSTFRWGPAPSETALKELSSISDSSFQSVINSILFALEEGKDHRAIAVSSPGPGEGKTTLTANLGLALSEIGHRVLLIDADLRRPSLHKVLGLENQGGLAEILSDSAPISSERIKTFVQRASAGLLDVLTAGEPAVDPFSLLHSTRASEVIEAIRGEYDLILIDTPPLLFVPESRLLGRVTDWSILVLRAGKTTADAALGAQRQMGEDGIPLLGTILNDCRPRHSSYGYSGYSAKWANG